MASVFTLEGPALTRAKASKMQLLQGGAVDLLGLPPALATVGSFALALAVGGAVGAGALWASKRFRKKKTIAGFLGLAGAPKRRRKRRSRARR